MKKELIIVLGILVTLTLITVATFNSNLGAAMRNRIIILLSYIKMLAVGFYFMELKKAHTLWKVSLSGILGIIVLIVCLM